MVVHIVSRVTVTDQTEMTLYLAAAPASVKAFNGRYITRSSNLSALEGDVDCERVVVLEFDNKADALAWYESEQYKPLKEQRQASANTTILLVE